MILYLDINEKAIIQLAKTILDAISYRFSIAPFTVIKHGIITEIISSKLYKVKIQGTEYSVPCCTDQIFQLHEKVVILTEQGNANKKYIIGRG